MYYSYFIFTTLLKRLIQYSISRDNAANNNNCISLFKDKYEKEILYPFHNDISCIAHIINLLT